MGDTFIEDLTYVSSDLLYFILHHFTFDCCIRFREGLSGIKVVIKTLSAGFHQPVERLRHVTLVSRTVTLVEMFKLEQRLQKYLKYMDYPVCKTSHCYCTESVPYWLCLINFNSIRLLTNNWNDSIDLTELGAKILWNECKFSTRFHRPWSHIGGQPVTWPRYWRKDPDVDVV